MPSHYDYDLIRDYLHGLVDRQTAREIAALIERDETARSIAQGILYLEKNLGSQEAVEMYLANFHERQQALITRVNNRPRVALWLKIAASLLLVVAVIAVIRMNTVTPAADAIALASAALETPYPVSGIVRHDAAHTALERGLEAYSAGDFHKAIAAFETAAGEPHDDPATLEFYRGLSHLYTGNFQRAVALLNQHVISESRYSSQAQWYRALALIRQNDFGAAKTILMHIAADNRHYKNQEARTLLSAF